MMFLITLKVVTGKKFRSFGAEIVSDVALGRRKNEPNQRLVSEISTFQTPQNSAYAELQKIFGRPRPRGSF